MSHLGYHHRAMLENMAINNRIIRLIIEILPVIEAEEQREARRRTKCRKRVKEKVKAEAESSKRRKFAKEKEQAEAESSRLQKRAKENAEVEILKCRKYAQKEVACDRRQCSEEVSDASSSKFIYAGAVLDVCYWKLGFYPEVVSFIQYEMVNFPTVKGLYTYNEPPKLIMLDEAGQCKEIIRIDNWKREHMLHFLRANLKPTSGV